MTRKNSRWSLTVFGKIGGKDACGGCVSSHNYLSKRRDKQKYPLYRTVDINSKLGKAATKKYGISRIPYIQKCRIKKDGSKGKCTSTTGWNQSQWS